jgi:NADPH:quinone reductase-like Zn-dependent oxidoreductase
MKAVLVYSYGDPSQLRYEETAMPKYGDDEVLVKMHATSLNPIDGEHTQRSSEVSHAYPIASDFRERPLW